MVKGRVWNPFKGKISRSTITVSSSLIEKWPLALAMGPWPMAYGPVAHGPLMGLDCVAVALRFVLCMYATLRPAC